MLAPAQTYCEKWQTCLDQIKSRTTEEEFVKWFKPIVPLEFDGKTLRLCVPNMSYVYQIEKHYIPFLRPIISQLYGQEIRLHYAVPKNDAQSVPVSKEADTTAISQFSTQTNTANIKNPFVIPGLKKIIIDTPTQGNGDKTRDGFLIRRNAIETGVYCITAMDTANALARSLETATDDLTPVDIATVKNL